MIVLITLAGAGLVWSAVSFFSQAKQEPVLVKGMEENEDNFAQAQRAELADRCQTPEGYSDQGWREHMSHHPDRYKECLVNNSQEIATGYHNIGADDLSDMLAHKDFILIDVHIPEQAHIAGTDAFIPFDEIRQRPQDLPQDKEAKVVVYCRSGNMSQRAAEDLRKMGYSNVYNLDGGTNEWQKQGYRVENIRL